MSKNMPSPDAALKDFFKDNEVFASLFNGYFFDNDKVIMPDDLKPDDTAYTATIKVKSKSGKKYEVENIKKYRDNIRRTSIGYLVILAIEDQDKIHYSMPVRKILYDALGYSSELSILSDTQDKVSWTVDERLSKVAKGTKVTPIITVVFYTGEKPWDGPRSLHDMMDMDERIKSLVPDYPLHIIDIGHDKDISFDNKFLRELKDTVYSVYSGSYYESEAVVSNSMLALTGVLTKDENLYRTALESERGEEKMCEAFAKRDAILIKEVKEKMYKDFAKRDAEIRREAEEKFALEKTKMCEAFAKRDAILIKEVKEKMYKDFAKRDAEIRREAEEKFALEKTRMCEAFDSERNELLIEIEKLRRQLETKK